MFLVMQMNRLLQGDVGSGKTLVSFLCMIMAVDNGFHMYYVPNRNFKTSTTHKLFQNILKILKLKLEF